MSVVYNPEADTVAELERLDLESKKFRRRLDAARTDEDRRVMTRLLNELREEYARLQEKLPW